MTHCSDDKTTASRPEMVRRDFIRGSAAATVAALAAPTAIRAAGGSGKLTAALIGCGSRGLTDARDFISSSEGVELTTLADAFSDKIDLAIKTLGASKGSGKRRPHAKSKTKINISRDRCFVGLDAYKQVMASDVDIVLLTTPPGFRALQLAAAVEAGKHVFMEKPAAVDVTGIRSIIASSELARRKKLSIVVGTQNRRMPHYVDMIRRIRDGQIGRPVAAQVYWHCDMVDWHYQPRRKGWSDVEWQIRCWPFFTWLSGDHIVEQHVHNLDMANCILGHPVQCNGRGGRQARVGTKYGNIYDHFGVEYEYPNGVRVGSFCSQMEKSSGIVGERFIGTKGQTWSSRGGVQIEFPAGKTWKYSGPRHSGGRKQFADLVGSIRTGKPVNEARQIAESTLTGIMGRMSAYTGRALKWDWALKASREDLMPKNLSLPGDLPVGPVAVPGKTRLV